MKVFKVSKVLVLSLKDLRVFKDPIRLLEI